jgi:hypothetical protein
LPCGEGFIAKDGLKSFLDLVPEDVICHVFCLEILIVMVFSIFVRKPCKGACFSTHATGQKRFLRGLKISSIEGRFTTVYQRCINCVPSGVPAVNQIWFTAHFCPEKMVRFSAKSRNSIFGECHFSPIFA